jgi:hypothetical protein
MSIPIIKRQIKGKNGSRTAIAVLELLHVNDNVRRSCVADIP